ncbi:hypothetical protein [Salinispira pacifica]|nr:hypothetical protein [Salinispira pacifica]
MMILSILLILGSCSEEKIPELSLPPTPVLSLRQDWAVIRFSYLPLYTEASIESEVAGLARQGDVHELLEQSLETELLYSRQDYWYKIALNDDHGEHSSAWAFAAGLEFYSSRDEALNASGRMAETQGF